MSETWRGIKKDWPVLKTEEKAERFVAEVDLTAFDFSQMVPMLFELIRKEKSVSLRLSDAPPEAVKRTAARQGIPCQGFLRQAIGQAITTKKAPQR